MFGRCKGQFFLITTLIFMIYLSTLLTSFSYESLLKQRESMEYYVYAENFENVKGEEKRIFTYFYENSSMKDFIKNFTYYVREKLELRNIELKTIFLLASYEKIQANQEQALNVSLLNLVKDEISNINITFTYNNTSKSLASLSDSKFFETSFNFNISSDSDYKLILKYHNGKNQEYEVSVPLRIGKSKKIGFWVISLKAENFLIKEDFEKIGE